MSSIIGPSQIEPNKDPLFSGIKKQQEQISLAQNISTLVKETKQEKPTKASTSSDEKIAQVEKIIKAVTIAEDESTVTDIIKQYLSSVDPEKATKDLFDLIDKMHQNEFSSESLHSILPSGVGGMGSVIFQYLIIQEIEKWIANETEQEKIVGKNSQKKTSAKEPREVRKKAEKTRVEKNEKKNAINAVQKIVKKQKEKLQEQGVLNALQIACTTVNGINTTLAFFETSSPFLKKLTPLVAIVELITAAYDTTEEEQESVESQSNPATKSHPDTEKTQKVRFATAATFSQESQSQSVLEKKSLAKNRFFRVLTTVLERHGFDTQVIDELIPKINFQWQRAHASTSIAKKHSDYIETLKPGGKASEAMKKLIKQRKGAEDKRLEAFEKKYNNFTASLSKKTFLEITGELEKNEVQVGEIQVFISKAKEAAFAQAMYRQPDTIIEKLSEFQNIEKFSGFENRDYPERKLKDLKTSIDSLLSAQGLKKKKDKLELYQKEWIKLQTLLNPEDINTLLSLTSLDQWSEGLRKKLVNPKYKTAILKDFSKYHQMKGVFNEFMKSFEKKTFAEIEEILKEKNIHSVPVDSFINQVKLKAFKTAVIQSPHQLLDTLDKLSSTYRTTERGKRSGLEAIIINLKKSLLFDDEEDILKTSKEIYKRLKTVLSEKEMGSLLDTKEVEKEVKGLMKTLNTNRTSIFEIYVKNLQTFVQRGAPIKETLKAWALQKNTLENEVLLTTASKEKTLYNIFAITTVVVGILTFLAQTSIFVTFPPMTLLLIGGSSSLAWPALSAIGHARMAFSKPNLYKTYFNGQYLNLLLAKANLSIAKLRHEKLVSLVAGVKFKDRITTLTDQIQYLKKLEAEVDKNQKVIDAAVWKDLSVKLEGDSAEDVFATVKGYLSSARYDLSSLENDDELIDLLDHHMGINLPSMIALAKSGTKAEVIIDAVVQKISSFMTQDTSQLMTKLKIKA